MPKESPALQLTTARLATSATVPGGTVFVDAGWRLRRTTNDAYLLRLEVVDGAGGVVASSTTDPFDGELETSRWWAGENVPLSLSAIVPRTTAPGLYTARLLVRFADGAEWKMAGPDGNDASSVTLGSVRIG